MKVSIEVGKGWCASICSCMVCGYEFTLIRQRKDKINCACPACGCKDYVGATETPWVGVIEEIVK